MSSPDRLQDSLGYQFRDSSLLTLALTHRSHGSSNNERLEFLGDSVLNFVIAQSLFERFDSASEGQLSRLRARMVKRPTLADVARDFDLGDFLILGSGELKSGGFERDSILSDALEAIIGAIFLEAGFDTARRCILEWFEGRLELLSLSRSQKDSKSRLQEFLQARGSDLPEYVVIELVGQSHEQEFVVECRSKLLDTPTRGQGASRRVAEQSAAALALVQLGVDQEPHHV